MDRQRPDYIPGPARLLLARFGEEVFHAVGIAFLVGSALERKDYRDVDVRVILEDDVFDRLAALTDISQGRQSSFNLAFSVLGERMTGLPVDFQIQRSTEANRDFFGVRQALFVGRATEAKANIAASAEIAVDGALKDGSEVGRPEFHCAYCDGCSYLVERKDEHGNPLWLRLPKVGPDEWTNDATKATRFWSIMAGRQARAYRRTFPDCFAAEHVFGLAPQPTRRAMTEEVPEPRWMTPIEKRLMEKHPDPTLDNAESGA